MHDDSLPQTGWYPDPADPDGSLRLWDGNAWTDKTSPKPRAAAPAPAPGPAPAPAFGQTATATLAPATAANQGASQRGLRQGQPVDLGLAAADLAGQQDAPATVNSGGSDAAVWPEPGMSQDLYPSKKGRRTGSRGSSKRIIVVASLLAVVLFVAALSAVAIPTVLSARAAAAGKAWYTGGVPGWPAVNGSAVDTRAETIIETWKVEGADFKGPGPYLAIVRLNLDSVAGKTSTQLLAGIVAEITLRDGSGGVGLTKLTDGAPAAQWSKPDGFGTDASDYYVYAEDGNHVYMEFLDATTQDYALALAVAKPLMMNFKGTGY